MDSPSTGLGFQPTSVSLNLFHKASRSPASASATGAATCSRFSSCTRFRPISVARTIPCSTSLARLLRTPISDPRGV